jgi:hypothetical protein
MAPSLYDVSILLPGLKLKSTKGSIPSGMIAPEDDSLAICLKYIDEGLFKLISSQNFSLAVTYLCEAEQLPAYAEDFVAENDDENEEIVQKYYDSIVKVIPCEKSKYIWRKKIYCF